MWLVEEVYVWDEGCRGRLAAVASLCIFVHQINNVATSVCGDGFTSVGAECDLGWLEAAMENKYDFGREVDSGQSQTTPRTYSSSTASFATQMTAWSTRRIPAKEKDWWRV